MSKLITVRLDDKGRVQIPRSIRQQLQADSGSLFFLQVDADGSLRIMRAPNPFDALAESAIKEADQQDTVTLEEFQNKHKISPS